MSELHFDETTHCYTVRGRVYPSVTGILKAAGLASNQYYTGGCAARGTAVHKATEAYDLGILDEGTYSDEVLKYVNGYRIFRRDTGFKPTAIELRVFSDNYAYAGTIDRIGELNGRSVLLDIKSGSVPAWVKYQLWAYFYAAIDRGYNPEACFSLQLLRTGKYKLKQHHEGNAFAVFLTALKNGAAGGCWR